MKKIFGFTVFMVLTCVIVGTVGAVEMLTNGGFETGNRGGWNATVNVIVTGTWDGVSPSEGSYQAVMSPSGGSDSDLWQPFDITGYPGATISFDYNLQAFDTSRLPEIGDDYFFVTYDSTEILRVYLNDAFGGGTTIYGWHSFSNTYSASVLTGPLTFGFHLENSPPGGGDPGQNLTGYVDNVSIDAIPEPGTTLLFGFGLLGLVGYGIRRKKKNA